MKNKKICPQCKRKLSINSNNFHKDSRNPNGFNGTCKLCRLNTSRVSASSPQAKKRKANYRKKTRSHIRSYKKAWEQNRAKTHPEFRIKSALRKRLWQSVKYGFKTDHTLNLLGCSFEYFIAYLESKLQKV